MFLLPVIVSMLKHGWILSVAFLSSTDGAMDMQEIQEKTIRLNPQKI